MKTVRAIGLIALLGVVGFGIFVLGYGFVWGYSSYKSGKLKNQDFEFFGQIVSESGDPIEGVSLVAEWKTYRENFISWNIKGRMATDVMKLDSDSNGRFEISGIRGVSLQIFDFHHPVYVIPGRKKYWGFSTAYGQPRTEGISYDDPFIVQMAETSNKTGP